MKKISEVFFYFFRLGLVGFGGPLALIAQMQKELVEDKKWISDREFRQAFALIKAMPGPVATQMAIYLARRRAGILGGLFGGIGIITPCFFLMVGLAKFYGEFVEWPLMISFLEGIQMAALALIFYSLRSLTKPYWKMSRFWILLLIGYLLMEFQSIPEFVLIFVLGCWSVIADKDSTRLALPQLALPVFLFLEQLPGGEVLTSQPELLEQIFWVCFRAGAFVFGTGLAIIPSLQTDFVQLHNWVTVDEFKDALAFGQLTPGPVVITVTFLGYKVAGLLGAVVATFAVFAPSFFHHLTWFPRAMSRLEKAKWLNAFLLGAISAVTGGIIYVVVQMTKDISPNQAIIFVISLAALFRFKIPPAVLILLAGLAALI